MCRKIFLGLAALVVCVSVQGAKPKKKSIQALLSQYEAYYGHSLNEEGAEGVKTTVAVPDFDKIFSEEFPDFITRNTAEANRLRSEAERLTVSARPHKELVGVADELIAGNAMVSALQSNSNNQVAVTTLVYGTDAQGNRVTLYGDRKNVLVAVKERVGETGGSTVVGDYENIDLPYYTPKYKAQAESFSQVNTALKEIDSIRSGYIAEVREGERRAEENRAAQDAAAAALLEKQIKNFKPDAAVAAANKFLAAKGHSVSQPRNVVNHGIQHRKIFIDDLSRFSAGLKAAESKLPALRRTLAQIKQASSLSAQNKVILDKNVKTLIEQNAPIADSFRKATSEVREQPVFHVTYTTGVVGEVTLYVNPNQTINHLTWMDASGNAHVEYPNHDAMMKVFGELSDAVTAMRKYARGK